jgi:hypothetical protein
VSSPSCLISPNDILYVGDCSRCSGVRSGLSNGPAAAVHRDPFMYRAARKIMQVPFHFIEGRTQNVCVTLQLACVDSGQGRIETLSYSAGPPLQSFRAAVFMEACT